MLVVCTQWLLAQERLGSVRYNPVVARASKHQNRSAERKTSTISLPFFEDFTGYSALPDSNQWVDREVYINNTMCVMQVSRGVATLDGLNQWGIPYDTVNNADFRYCDSLTSQPIDLDFGTVVPGDSLYLSFFYQAQGNGYYPMPQDSLMLYFANVFGDWVKVWSIPGPDSGATVQPFTQVLIPITDSLLFSGSFQFRFVNISALDWADADWNVDYIRIGANRSMYETGINELAITNNPAYLLNDYTSMPYYQFLANISGELVAFTTDSIRNDSSLGQNINHTFIVYDTTGGASTVLSPAVSNNVPINGYTTQQLSEPLTMPTTYPSYPRYKPVTFETECYLVSTPFTGATVNDTVAVPQTFSNYLAYDDGTAEQAYYLTQTEDGSLPAELEIEFHLNEPDTLQGLAIYFARQIPLAEYKEFFIRIYSSLINVNGSYNDILLREQDYNFPGYIDTINHFWVYTLDTPVVLPAGTFYVGTVQPAYSNSDSLYFGYDANRVGGNHTYFRVNGAGTAWSPSLLAGQVMIRPLLGYGITSSRVAGLAAVQKDISLVPNPAGDHFMILAAYDGQLSYAISDMSGRQVATGATLPGKPINITALEPGMYLVSISQPGAPIIQKKLTKI